MFRASVKYFLVAIPHLSNAEKIQIASEVEALRLAISKLPGLNEITVAYGVEAFQAEILRMANGRSRW